MNHQIQQLQRENQDLQEQNNKKNREIHQLQIDIDHMKSQVQELQRKEVQMKNKSLQLEEEISKLTLQLLEEKNQMIVETREHLRQKRQMHNKISELEYKNEKNSRVIEQVEEEENNTDDGAQVLENSDIRNVILQLQEENDNRSRKIQHLEKEQDRMNNEITDLEQEKSIMKKKILQLQEQGSNKEREIEHLQEEKNNTNNEVQVLKKEKNEINNKILQLQKQNANTNKEMKQLREEKNHTDNVVQELQTEKSEMDEKILQLLDQKNRQSAEIKKIREELQDQNNNKDRKIQTLENENGELNSRIEKLKEQNNTMTTEIQQLQVEKNDIDGEIQQLRQEKSQSDSEILQLRQNHANQNNEIQELRQEIDRTVNENLRLRERKSSINAGRSAKNTTSSLIAECDSIVVSDQELGRGAYATVYKGDFYGTTVAVKKIHKYIVSPHNLQMLQREIDIASQCRHPNLLQFLCATKTQENHLSIVTEIMDMALRTLLEQRNEQKSRLDCQQVKSICLDVARGLNYLHSKKPNPIIHRDVSSANVLLWMDGSVVRKAKISDYGSVNLMSACKTVNPGAALYAAPEAGLKKYDPKIDVFSYGILVCETSICEQPVSNNVERKNQMSRIPNDNIKALVEACTRRDPRKRTTMKDSIEFWQYLCIKT